MQNLLFLADFFSVEYAEKDPEMQEFFNQLSGVSVKVVADPLFQEPADRMAVIRSFEKDGIENVEPDGTILEAVAAAEILLVHWSPVNRKVIDAAPNLKLIASLRSGLENIDTAYAASKGIQVIHCPGRLADSVADLTVSLMLAWNKGLFRRDLKSLNGEWSASRQPKYQSRIYRPLCMLKIGLVGFGAIAQTVAGRLAGFGCALQAYDPFTPGEVFERLNVRQVELDELLTSSDFISVHVRVTEETKGMIGEAEFRKMSAESVFINTARADIVDEAAMIEALRTGEILGAGLDVFAQEPLPADHPLLQLDNVILTPHIGGVFPGTLPLSLSKVIGKIQDYLAN